MSMIDRLRAQARPRTDPLVDLYTNQMQRSTGAGDAAEDLYFQRARSFDPRSAVRDTAGALFDQFEETTGRRIADLRGSMVGAGRLGGGYGELDEAETVYDGRRDLNRQVAGLSLDAERLSLANTEGLGAYGARRAERGLDLVTGERDRQDMLRETARNRRAQLWGSLAGGAGTVAGSYYGRGSGGGGGG